MGVFTPAALSGRLQALVPAAASGDLCLAFSGGGDSTVLLAALADLREQGYPGRLRAVHVDHQLHPDSGTWQMRCAEAARARGIDYRAVQVSVSAAREGTEAAARRSRYRVLFAQLAPGECLLTAHHADDQLETLLLAVVRGAGVRGLAGMPGCVRRGPGWLLRPLLPFTRAELAEWATVRGLEWIEDPANREHRFARSYLRSEVTPRLVDRWPGAARVAVRTAAHLAEASSLLDELALHDLGAAGEDGALRIASLAGLSSARRRNLLRYWLRSLGLSAPPARRLASLERDMLVARVDRNLLVAWDGTEVRSHRGLLYAGPPLPRAGFADAPWDWREPFALPAGTGELHMMPATTGLAAARLPAVLTVSWRAAGDRTAATVKAAWRRPLGKLLQEKRILPWWRDRVPLVFAGDVLVAVADFWCAPGWRARPGEAALRIDWPGRPPLQAAGSVLSSSGPFQ